MGLIKLMILAAILWFALRLWRRLQGQQQPADRTPADCTAPVMVRCARCQIHLPQSLALRAGNNWYCCTEHRDDCQS
jgi:uncharacterized protein